MYLPSCLRRVLSVQLHSNSDFAKVPLQQSDGHFHGNGLRTELQSGQKSLISKCEQKQDFLSHEKILIFQHLFLSQIKMKTQIINFLHNKNVSFQRAKLLRCTTQLSHRGDHGGELQSIHGSQPTVEDRGGITVGTVISMRHHRPVQFNVEVIEQNILVQFNKLKYFESGQTYFVSIFPMENQKVLAKLNFFYAKFQCFWKLNSPSKIPNEI